MATPHLSPGHPASANGWSSPLPPDLAAAAVEVAVEVARRVTGSDRGRQVDLATGDAGIAVLCGQLTRTFPGDGWDRRAVDYLTPAPALLPGMFKGTGGLAYAAWFNGAFDELTPPAKRLVLRRSGHRAGALARGAA